MYKTGRIVFTLPHCSMATHTHTHTHTQYIYISLWHDQSGLLHISLNFSRTMSVDACMFWALRVCACILCSSTQLNVCQYTPLLHTLGVVKIHNSLYLHLYKKFMNMHLTRCWYVSIMLETPCVCVCVCVSCGKDKERMMKKQERKVQGWGASCPLHLGGSPES